MLLILALILFFLLHLLPFKTGPRQKLIKHFGLKTYKFGFRIAVLFCLILCIFGWNSFPNIYFYEPSLALKQLHIAFMFPVIFLFVIAEIKNNFKRFIPHPMLTGVQIGTLSHLIANGDLRSIILFSSFFIYACWARWQSNQRKEQNSPIHSDIHADIRALCLTVGMYILLIGVHGYLFGIPVYVYVM